MRRINSLLNVSAHPFTFFVHGAGNTCADLTTSNSELAGSGFPHVVTVGGTALCDPDTPAVVSTRSRTDATEGREGCGSSQGPLIDFYASFAFHFQDPPTFDMLWKEGTSYSAPQVTALAAILRSIDPTRPVDKYELLGIPRVVTSGALDPGRPPPPRIFPHSTSLDFYSPVLQYILEALDTPREVKDVLDSHNDGFVDDADKILRRICSSGLRLNTGASYHPGASDEEMQNKRDWMDVRIYDDQIFMAGRWRSGDTGSLEDGGNESFSLLAAPPSTGLRLKESIPCSSINLDYYEADGGVSQNLHASRSGTGSGFTVRDCRVAGHNESSFVNSSFVLEPMHLNLTGQFECPVTGTETTYTYPYYDDLFSCHERCPHCWELAEPERAACEPERADCFFECEGEGTNTVDRCAICRARCARIPCADGGMDCREMLACYDRCRVSPDCDVTTAASGSTTLSGSFDMAFPFDNRSQNYSLAQHLEKNCEGGITDFLNRAGAALLTPPPACRSGTYAFAGASRCAGAEAYAPDAERISIGASSASLTAYSDSSGRGCGHGAMSLTLDASHRAADVVFDCVGGSADDRTTNTVRFGYDEDGKICMMTRDIIGPAPPATSSSHFHAGCRLVYTMPPVE